MTPLPDGIQREELPSSKGAPLPHLTLSPRSMSSDEEHTAVEDDDTEQDIPMVNAAAPEPDKQAAQGQTTQPQTRGRSTTMHQTPGSPNARSKSITVADGNDTQGMINRHPAAPNSFTVGVASDKNKKCRRTMEDSHAFVYDYGNVPGQGYFAVFDGHAGKHAAEWCGSHFHEYLLTGLEGQPEQPVPDVFNATFHKVDDELSKMAATHNTHSGCTAVTAFLRVEDANGKPVATPQLTQLASIPSNDPSQQQQQQPDTTTPEASSSSSSQGGNSPTTSTSDKRRSSGSNREKIMSFITRSTTRSRRSSATGKRSASAEKEDTLSKSGLRRVLYTANVGDARAIICRGGKAVRLTYDHKGSDQQEAKRITDAGGFVMNHRVNGILAVTRSLGDSSMKEFVVGSPYTTETVIGPQDDWLVVACDGLWDVCEDQEVADLLCKTDVKDAQDGAEKLLDVALSRFSSDNISVLVIKL